MTETKLTAALRVGVPGLLILASASAVWVESDLYRYTAGLLVAGGFAVYCLRLRRGDWLPRIGAMGWACVVWSGFVAAHFLLAYRATGRWDLGSAEGIYFFPLVYPTLGYALFLFRGSAASLVWIAMNVSLLVLALTIEPAAILERDKVAFLFHNNTIHASVGAGLIALLALSFAQDRCRAAARSEGAFLLPALVAAAMVFGLCLLGVFGATSKGVWLAVAIALPAWAAFLLVGRDRERLARGALAGAAVLLVGILVVGVLTVGFAFEDRIAATLGPYIESAGSLLSHSLTGSGPMGAVRQAIASGEVPTSFNERLMLWVNALEIWQAHPVFGAGPRWALLWDQTSFSDSIYRIVHNGYLEIAMRYGLVGLAFFATLAIWSIFQAARAWSEGLISLATFQFHAVSSLFFAITLLTNSNNRLAIGESFMLLAGAFGFCFFYLRQAQGSLPPVPRGLVARFRERGGQERAHGREAASGGRR